MNKHEYVSERQSDEGSAILLPYLKECLSQQMIQYNLTLLITIF